MNLEILFSKAIFFIFNKKYALLEPARVSNVKLQAHIAEFQRVCSHVWLLIKPIIFKGIEHTDNTYS